MKIRRGNEADPSGFARIYELDLAEDKEGAVSVANIRHWYIY